jgi:hypothetical protein
MLLEMIHKLGEDDLAEVYIGRLTTPDGPVLVTVRRLRRMAAETPGVLDNLREASGNLVSFSHDRVARHLGFAESGGEHYWINERAPGFDLGAVFKRLASREVRITVPQSLQIGLDLLQGLAAVHERNQFVGTVGSMNVMVGYNGATRLEGTGFDTALYRVSAIRQKGRRGRAAYAAPETRQARAPDVQMDVYSAAALIYHLLTGRTPLGDDARGGMAASVRHVAVEPPSKIDRSLPYSCDAVLLKALSTAPSGRHESADALHNAVSRLRAAVVTGPDEGRGGVAGFVTALYPNEATVPGQPGTLKRPALKEGIEVEGLGLPASRPELAEDEDTPPDGAMQMDEVTPPDGNIAVKVAGAREPPESQEPAASEKEVPDPGALARIAAWEAAYGEYGNAKDAAAPPAPPAPPPKAPAGPPPLPATPDSDPAAGEVDSSIVVNWSELDSGPDKETTEPELEMDVKQIKPPEVPLVRPPTEKARTPIVVRDAMVVDEETEEDTVEASPLPEAAGEETRPDPDPLPEPPPKSTGASVASLIVIGLVAAVVGAVGALAISGAMSGDDSAASGEQGMTEVGFLTLEADRPVKVTLDGELLLKNDLPKRRPLPAGAHRLRVDTIDGDTLMDESIQMEAGEKRVIRLVVPASPSARPPDATESVTEEPAPKPAGKKRTRKRRRRKRRARTFR